MNDWLGRVHFGDCVETLRRMPESVVHTCVTSPPYFGLRDYGVAPSTWPACTYRTLGGEVAVPAMEACLGLEPTPEAFIAHLVMVLREVRRVLRNDGTAWLNLGDSYCSRPNGSIGKASRLEGEFTSHTEFRRAHSLRKRLQFDGLKHKDLIGIPWMAAFALRADGWYLRQDVIWNKSNPMPESVRDRCTKAHESIFLLAKSESYYFDQGAISEPVSGDPSAPRNRWDSKDYDVPGQKPQKRVTRSGNAERKPGSSRGCPEGTPSNVNGSVPWEGSTRNKRSVWTVSTKPYGGAHFATFPPDLIEPCILAGAPAGGVVLDPFMGSGTTGEVAQRLGRQWIGCELNPGYEPLQRERLRQSAFLLESTP